MTLGDLRIWIAGLALGLAPAWGDGEAGPYSVLRIARGDTLVFKAVPAGEVAAEKTRLAREARESRTAWEAARAAFQADKANRGREFLELEPEAVAVTAAREALPGREEAEAIALELEVKARRWAVVRITGCDGKEGLEVLAHARIRARLIALNEEYARATAAWEEDMDDATGAGGLKKGGTARAGRPRGGRRGLSDAPPKPSRPKLVRLKEQIASEAEALKALEALK